VRNAKVKNDPAPIDRTGRERFASGGKRGEAEPIGAGRILHFGF